MKRYYSIILLVFFVQLCANAQKKISWSDLSIEYDEEWSEEYNAVYMVPKFEPKQKDLDSTIIRIKGKIMAVDIEQGYFVLGKELSHFGCCGSTRPDEVMELSFSVEPKGLKNDKDYWVEGMLVLNRDDILQLNYILKDVRIIKKPK